jgi:hypothetical protein
MYFVHQSCLCSLLDLITWCSQSEGTVGEDYESLAYVEEVLKYKEKQTKHLKLKLALGIKIGEGRTKKKEAKKCAIKAYAKAIANIFHSFPSPFFLVEVQSRV